jgi:hypothetical protein
MSDQEQEPGTNGAHPQFIVEDVPVGVIQLPGETPLSPDRTMMAKHLYQVFPPDFVNAYPDARVEVAVAHPVSGAINKAETFSPFEIEKICDFAEAKNIAGCNVYIGPALRKGSCPQHARSSDSHVLTSAVAWAEYDCQGDDERVQTALGQIGLQVTLANTTGTIPASVFQAGRPSNR